MGETIDLAFPGGAGRTLLVLDLAAQATTAESSSGSVDVQIESGRGEWTTVASLAPRRSLDRTAIDVTGAVGARVQIGRRVLIRSISTLTQASEAVPRWLALSNIELSAGGQAKRDSITLAPAEHGVLLFAGTGQEGETERSVFLRVTSRSESFALSSRARQDHPSSPEVALSLTMRPNPAAGRVAVDFTMAHTMNAKIRIYDAAGRLVRTLANGLLAAGAHSVVWDGEDDASGVVRDGLYFCKMEVGSWVSMRKMVFLVQR